jgi:hypothetical protein
MRVVFAIVAFLAACAPAAAFEKKLDAATLRDLFRDIRLTSTETGRVVEQVIQSSGATFTVDIETSAQSQGFWRLEGDKYCSQWPPSQHWTCYDVFGNDDGIVFVSSTGTRYQMELPPAD